MGVAQHWRTLQIQACEWRSIFKTIENLSLKWNVQIRQSACYRDLQLCLGIVWAHHRLTCVQQITRIRGIVDLEQRLKVGYMMCMARRFAEMDSRDTCSSHVRICRLFLMLVKHNRSTHCLLRSHGEARVEMGQKSAHWTGEALCL